MKIIDTVLRFFFPQKCPVCGKILETTERTCKECKNAEIRISKDFCHRCGYDKERCICSPDEIAFSHITAPYIYSGTARAKIHDLKFHGKKAVGKQFGDELAFRVAECFYGAEFDCVTFVPMSKKSIKERGYNQSEILAKRIAKRLFIPCESLLTKKAETKKQHELDVTGRKNNLKNAFEASEKVEIKGKTILLCDDVKTTGSTLKECEKVLFKSGAKEVYCICIALSDYGDIFPLERRG